MEFDNQCNRIYNQLDFEKQRDTESMLNEYYTEFNIANLIVRKELYLLHTFINY